MKNVLNKSVFREQKQLTEFFHPSKLLTVSFFCDITGLALAPRKN